MGMFLKFTSEDLLAAFRTRERSHTCSIKVHFRCFIVFRFDGIYKNHETREII